mmetsp:Transcript_6593/g.8030  ORF Transcript_6593/g.8030 Transcript_6593/m.8030 type:complete len:149 (+) Transcript_6593:219-665(+)
MSRPSRRRETSKIVKVPPGVLTGLKSLVKGNEEAIANMLDCDVSEDENSKAVDTLVQKLVDCLNVNNLNAEGLLARFFGADMLSTYCITVLGKSGKGKEPVLAARISREWSKPDFSPKPDHIAVGVEPPAELEATEQIQKKKKQKLSE